MELHVIEPSVALDWSHVDIGSGTGPLLLYIRPRSTPGRERSCTYPPVRPGRRTRSRSVRYREHRALVGWRRGGQSRTTRGGGPQALASSPPGARLERAQGRRHRPRDGARAGPARSPTGGTPRPAHRALPADPGSGSEADDAVQESSEGLARLRPLRGPGVLRTGSVASPPRVLACPRLPASCPRSISPPRRGRAPADATPPPGG